MANDKLYLAVTENAACIKIIIGEYEISASFSQGVGNTRVPDDVVVFRDDVILTEMVLGKEYVPFGSFEELCNIVDKVRNMVEEEQSAHEVEKCPECGHPLVTKWSGVKCSNPDCSYWFCL